jgi:hypothetical protein
MTQLAPLPADYRPQSIVILCDRESLANKVPAFNL